MNRGALCSGQWDIGRIYQTRGGPDSLRWFWSMTVKAARMLAHPSGPNLVAHSLVLEHHRIRVRCARHLCREQLRQGHARDRTRTQEPDAKRGLGVPLAIPAEPGTILIVKTASLPKLSRPRSEGFCLPQVTRCGWPT